MPIKKHKKKAESGIDLDKIRFQAEVELERILEEDFALAQYYDIFDNREQLESITNEMLSNTLLLSPVIAPRIYNLCQEIQEKLGFDEKIDFYLQSSADINAFSINGFDFVPHIICFTSSLIQNMTDDELRFVIGHEMGHLIYDHNKLDIIQKFLNKSEGERIPAMIALHYLRFIKYAEISSDRVGFLAIPEIKVATHTFFKLSCGLSEEDLNFDADEYLKQLDRIREIGVGNLYTTHPNSMIRIKALMDFAASELSPHKAKKPISAKKLNDNVLDLLSLLETKPKKEKDKKIVEFLSAVGMYMASYDPQTMREKWNALYDWISDYTTQPEVYLEFKDRDAMMRQKRRICKYYADRQDSDKFTLLQRVVYLTLMDGRLEQEEKKRLIDIGASINISADAVNLIIREASEAYLEPDIKMKLGDLQ
jgi:hypothetical protein